MVKGAYEWDMVILYNFLSQTFINIQFSKIINLFQANVNTISLQTVDLIAIKIIYELYQTDKLLTNWDVPQVPTLQYTYCESH